MRRYYRHLRERRILRYVLSGILSFCIENLSFLFFYYPLRIDVRLANILSVCAALTVNFFVSKSYVFSLSVKEGRPGVEFLKYVLLIAFNLTTSTVLVTLLVGHGVAAWMAKPTISLLIAAWTYVAYKKFIFNRTS